MGMGVWVVSVDLPNTYRILVWLVLEEREVTKSFVGLHMCFSSVVCPFLCLEGQPIHLQLGWPKIIRKTKCWQEVSACCFVKINPVSAVSLLESLWDLSSCWPVIRNPSPQDGLCCFYIASLSCWPEAPELSWDLSKVSSVAMQYPAIQTTKVFCVTKAEESSGFNYKSVIWSILKGKKSSIFCNKLSLVSCKDWILYK